MLLRLVLLFASIVALELTLPFGQPSLCGDEPQGSTLAVANELETVAEESDFTATATHEQVMALARKLADASKYVHLTSFGKSHEGRELPLLIIADPPLQTADEIRQSGKTIVFAMGNIHAGEVCGKEALLMLARDLTQPQSSPLLKEVVVLLAPIYNADGNEPISTENRPDQKGPAKGVGLREPPAATPSTDRRP